MITIRTFTTAAWCFWVMLLLQTLLIASAAEASSSVNGRTTTGSRTGIAEVHPDGSTTTYHHSSEGESPLETESVTTTASSRSDRESTSTTENDNNNHNNSIHHCHTLQLIAFNDDIERGERMLPGGRNTFQYPIYAYDDRLNDDGDDNERVGPRPLRHVGKYIGASTSVGDDDCVGTGSFLLEYNAMTDSYDSQVFVATSCSGEQNVIVGGTGRFVYLKNGHERIVDAENEEVEDDDAESNGSDGKRRKSVSELYFCF